MQERSMSVSSGDMFALLNSIKSDDEGDLAQLKAMMRKTLKKKNDSDTEFVAEEELVISTNIIRKEEITDQSSSVSVPEASVYILSTQNEDETDNLGPDSWLLLLPLNVLPISHLLLLMSVLQISRLLLQYNLLPTSHLLLLLLGVLPVSHPNLLLLLQLL